MSKFSCFGTRYGVTATEGGGLGICVQEAHNKNGRLIALRTCLIDADGEPIRHVGYCYPIRPNLLPGLIAALRNAQRHSDELKKAELAALGTTAANDEVA